MGEASTRIQVGIAGLVGVIFTRKGINDLITEVHTELKPMQIDGKTFTGSMYLNLVFEYIESINKGEKPTILAALESVISSETRKYCDETSEKFQTTIEEYLSEEGMPYPMEFFHSTFS